MRMLVAAVIVGVSASLWLPSMVDGVDGGPIAVQTWGTDGSVPSSLPWRPDESRDDAALRNLRTQLLGRTVYGFGTLSISCAPQWTRVYRYDVPLRVVSVTRDKGTVSQMGTGDQIGLTMYGPTFYAADPIRIVFALPSQPPLGTNYHVPGHAGPCPALVLADFQVTSALSTKPPPRGLSCPAHRIPLGMTRDALVWCRGYPWEIADAETLRRESTWHYGIGQGNFSVTFSHENVIAVDPP
jgi:hypothetical protein